MPLSDTQGGEHSLEVGDRIVLQGLVNATHLNGRHGCIVTPLNSDGRFGVDIDVDSQRRAIKPVNLAREEEEDDGLTIVQAVNGVLPEHPHGRAASYLLDLMRVNAAYHYSDDGEITQYDLERYRSSPPFGLIKIAHLTSLGWSHWVKETGDGLELGDGDKDGIYEIMKLGHVQTLDQFPSQDDIPPELIFANEALESKHAAGGWHVRVHGTFWMVGESPDDGGCFLIPEGNKNMVYKVLGVRNALYPLVSRHGTRPMLYAATLIPWFGTLLYDGVLMPAHNRPVPKQASPALAEKLHAAVDAAVNEGRVITRLRDTQAVLDTAATQSRVEPNRNPPSPEETRCMEELAALPSPVEPGNNFEALKPWAWTFRRAGYTEEENPSHSGLVISAAGSLVGPFECSALAPTSVDILRSAVQYATKFNRQPKVLSIDERVCCDRVKFLLGGTDSKIRVEYYRPPSKEESDAAIAMGDMR
jgi:hypothetical protein